MTQENPYKAPASVVGHTVDSAPRRWGAMLLSLIGLQVLVAAIYAPTALSRMQRGDISVLVFFTVVLSSILLAVGGFMYFRKARASAYLFFASALFFAIVYLQWRPTFVFTGFMIATCAGLVSAVAMRRLAKVKQFVQPEPASFHQQHGR